ncbi:MAG TPA: Rpn family recombination-promoting nuclease/putative transposase, partial [Clostridiales bacterium]|nr:Rpn family recombination-promoting nuclease/putative transposase [Clostridiales bacterium]
MNQQTQGNRIYAKSTKLFDPKIDFAFKQVFGQDNPECKKVLLHLLNSTFQRKNGLGIKSIEYVNPYLDKVYDNDKESILDIKVKNENNELIDIEMQIASHTHFIKRCLLYWASMYDKQLSEGEDYNKLKHCIVVSIVDFELDALAEMDDYHGVFELLERNCYIKMTDHCELHFIQLPKVHFKCELKDTDNL